MRFFITLIRNLLGGIIAFFDVITRGRKLKRSAQAQQQIEAELETLTLYQFFACPFCIKTRRAMYKMNLPITKRNVSQGSPYREELLQGGGKVQTPCLRIESTDGVQWLYDSNEIINYLRARFAPLISP
ncbi:glutathione S-transferase N-terminal domain-containing protein [Glaciecola sp. SC05]|uniref:glutathione S-transferase N-terminal domain-containing protein n=1 Tax=Glaciecola sp. SC05 TaxID=1987355 RepID=UPI0035284C8C